MTVPHARAARRHAGGVQLGGGGAVVRVGWGIENAGWDPHFGVLGLGCVERRLDSGRIIHAVVGHGAVVRDGQRARGLRIGRGHVFEIHQVDHVKRTVVLSIALDLDGSSRLHGVEHKVGFVVEVMGHTATGRFGRLPLGIGDCRH